MKKILIAAAVLFAGIAVLPLFADEAAPAAAAPAKKKYQDKQYNEVYKLFDAMKMQWQLEESMNQVFAQQFQALPPELRQKFEPVVKDFLKKYITFDALKEDIANVYLDNFTIDEIKGLTAFYATPLGQKVIQSTPAITAASMKIGEARVRQHEAELQAALMKAMQQQQ